MKGKKTREKSKGPDPLCVAIIGSGGDGVVTAGDLLARAASNAGLHCQMVKSFGPQIRGGESGVWLQISRTPVRRPAEAADVVVMLSWNSYPQFARQLRFAPGAAVFQDEGDTDAAPSALADTAGKPVHPVALPLQRIADALETPRARNMVATGFVAGLLALPDGVLPGILRAKFAQKKPELATSLIRALEQGRAIAGTLPQAGRFHVASVPGAEPRILLSGNDAAALGALHAGVEFFAGYPITPASEIMTAMAEHLPGRGGMMVQAEDEIASICMVIGASFGGKRSMTATSGPGLSLMVEALGFASQIEIPCVIVNVQRGGPSTGMPTKTEQSDLQLAIYGAHGDAPRVVLAPENVKTCFDTMVKAFYLSETYQTPVLVLSDQNIGHREETLSTDAFGEGNAFRTVGQRKLPELRPGEPYKRFELGDDPVSAMALPGMEGGCYRTSGIIHDETGNPNLATEMHRRMSEKLARKMERILGEFPGWRREGPARAESLIVTWGSTAGAACEAAAARTAAGNPTAVLVVEMLNPLPVDAIAAEVERCKHLAIAELTFSGQFARWLRANGIGDSDTLLIHRGGGDPLLAGEILQRMEETWK